MSTLHLTNGDCTVETLLQTGLGGDVFAWRDALHEGPVPAGSRGALRTARADFLAGTGWGSPARLERELRERDERLAAALGTRPLVVWLEHDLYDQLQLLEILSFVDERLVESDLLAAPRTGAGIAAVRSSRPDEQAPRPGPGRCVTAVRLRRLVA